MAVHSEQFQSLRAVVGRNRSTLVCGLFVSAVLLGVALGQDPAFAVYLLSFWHYYLYWLAFAFGKAPFDVFKRDAMAMKTVAIVALATAYFAAPLDFVSLAVVAGGFLLNLKAAAVLGFDRTYYGQEVAGLPPRRIAAFPYGLIAHPMIAGNVAAFSGTLLNPAFAERWWPLAGLHVALNIALLAMELARKPHGRLVRIGGLLFAGALFGAAFLVLGHAKAAAVPFALAGGLQLAAAFACALMLYRCYAHATGPDPSARRTT